MKLTLSWLKTHLDTTAPADKLAKALVDTGLEVEAMTDESARLNHVVIGKIITRLQHPNADRLGVCTVDVGDGTTRQIVCGAPNARDGLTVAVALPGAKLPNGAEIGASKIRGVDSNGMICSQRELGLGDEHNGIWEIDTKLPLGTPLVQYFGGADVSLEIKVTPNRGDALSVFGVARDLAAARIGALKELTVPAEGKTPNRITGTIDSDDGVFLSLIEITGLKNGKSPDWLIRRLESAGLRPINAAVDVTNFILADLGQPLHAYDADKLKGNLRVVNAAGGEVLPGLDGRTHTLNKGDLIIADDSGPVGLAGIVGGVPTSVTEGTTRVLLEAAQFKRSRITRTGQKHQIFSDARQRFERGISPAMTMTAALRAAQLITEICGGTFSAVFKTGTELPKPTVIAFDPAKVRTFGGLDLTADTVQELLESLQFKVTRAGKLFNVTVPYHFTQMETWEDLVEEVLRLKGLDTIPAALPAPRVDRMPRPATLKVDRFARRHLAGQGYMEAITYSFIPHAHAVLFGGGSAGLTLTNPIDAATMSDMRPSLLPGLVEAAKRNLARGETTLRLAEVGQRFTADGAGHLTATVVHLGPDHGRHWAVKAEAPTLFDVKATALSLIESWGIRATTLQVTTGAPGWYHPGRSGTIKQGSVVLATFGDLHPSLLKALDIKGPVVAAEVDLSALSGLTPKTGAYAPSAYQAVTRDLAFVVDAGVAAADLVQTLRGADRDLVKEVDLFDLYAGDKLPAGKKSLAVSLTLQAADRTLTDADITAVCDKAVTAAQKRFKAELRS